MLCGAVPPTSVATMVTLGSAPLNPCVAGAAKVLVMVTGVSRNW